MTDRQALIHAIHHDPDDDAPRLILADWFEEHGEEERAVLIRRMVAAPTYRLFWSKTAKHTRHEHQEPVKAIRGLRTSAARICQADWDFVPEVERVVIRRGFVEAITIQAWPFLNLAGQLFARSPIQEVTLSDLRPSYSFDRPSLFEALVANFHFTGDHWPADLFSEHEPFSTLYFTDYEEAYRELSKRAAGYGRLKAGMRKEPPALPDWDLPLDDTGLDGDEGFG